MTIVRYNSGDPLLLSSDGNYSVLAHRALKESRLIGCAMAIRHQRDKEIAQHVEFIVLAHIRGQIDIDIAIEMVERFLPEPEKIDDNSD